MNRHSNGFRATAVLVANLYIAALNVSCGSKPQLDAPDAPSQQRERITTYPDPISLVPVTERDALAPPAGELTVSPSGEAIWSMPIWVPAGRNGIQPSLAVTYSSRGGSTILGERFGLAGFSKITRCWRSPSSDGDEHLPSAQATPSIGTAAQPAEAPEFCLDGQRLVRGPHGLTPEFDPGTLVKVNGAPGSPPSSFEVRYRDGRIASYGARDTAAHSVLRGPSLRVVLDNRQRKYISKDVFYWGPEVDVLSDLTTVSQVTDFPVEWDLDELKDRFGNSVEYNYQLLTVGDGAREILPDEIRWTRSSVAPGLAPSRRIRFHYREAERAQVRESVRSGVKIREAHLLERLEVRALDGAISDEPAARVERRFREYRFSYRENAPGVRPHDLLEAVTECYFRSDDARVDPGVCSAPTQFTWTGASTPLIPEFSSAAVVATSSEFGSPISQFTSAEVLDALDLSVGDFNGDGFDDVLYRVPRYTNGETEERATATEEGRQVALGYWVIRLGSPTGLTARRETTGLPRTPGGELKFGARPIDLDGDGKKEVMIASLDVAPGAAISNLSPALFAIYSLATCDSQRCSFEPLPSSFDMVGLPFIATNHRRGYELLTNDLDGDALTDLVRAGDVQSSPLPNLLYRKQSASSPRTFEPPIPLTFQWAGASPRQLLTFPGDERYWVDINGSGKAQLLLPSRNRNAHYQSHLPPLFSAFTFARGAAGQMNERIVNLPARSSEQSSLAASIYGNCAQGVDPFALPSSQLTPFSRYFIDYNGDGLPDSVSAPGSSVDACGRLLDGTKLILLSNIGGTFAPGRAATVAPSAAFNYSKDTFLFADGRHIDPGARVVDLDGDGREDFVQLAVGHSVTTPNGPVRRQANAVWLKSLGNGSFEAHDLSIPAAPQVLVAFPSGTPAGYGSRLSQFGDFNGDGALDVTALTQGGGGVRLEVYAGIPVQPPMVTAFDQGPLLPKRYASYAWAGPASAPLYTQDATCSARQVCLKRLGWVVSAHAEEAGGFATSAPGRLRFGYQYESARLDMLGRGFLGVDRRIRTMSEDVAGAAPLAKGTTEFDFSPAQLVCHPGTAKCAYANGGRAARQRTETYLTNGKVHAVEARFQRELEPLVFNPDGRGFRSSIDRATYSELEGPPGAPALLRSSRSRADYDEFANLTSQRSEVASVALSLDDAPPASGRLHRLTTYATGTNAADTTRWLVSRYGGWATESFESELPPQEQEQLRLLRVLEYEPESVEVREVEMGLPNAPAETDDTPGAAERVRTTRSARGFVSSITRSGSNQDRTWSWAFSPRDSDEIFPQTATNPLGHAAQVFSHGVFGTPIAMDDANGSRTSISLDALGRVVRSRTPGHGEVTASFRSELNSNGIPLRTRRLCTTSTATGTQCGQLDPLGRVLQAVSDGFSGPSYVDTEYDVRGYPTARTLPYFPGGPTPPRVTFTQDGMGRTTQVSRPGETPSAPRLITSTTYDGLKVTTISERDVSSSVEIDERGLVVREATQDPLNPGHVVETQRQYGHWGLPRKVLAPVLPPGSMSPMPAQPDITIEYDGLGRRTRVVDPSAGTQTFLYNAFNELKRTDDANGGVLRLTRDKLGRITEASTEVGGQYESPVGNEWALRNTFVYDSAPNGIGLLASASSNDGVAVARTYDAFSRLDSETWTELGASFGFKYHHDSSGRTKRLDYPSSGGQTFSAEYAYAPTGEVSEIWDVTNESSRARLWQQVAANPAGLSTEELFGTSTRVKRFYDDLNRIRLVRGAADTTGTVFQLLSLKWDAGDLLKEKRDVQGAASETYRHDFLGRLDKWTINQGCESISWNYTYDDWGNLRSRIPELPAGLLPQNFPSQTYEYTVSGNATAPHAVKRISATSEAVDFTYNPAGQLTSARGEQLDWLPSGLPWRVRRGAQGETKYAHDPFGGRFSKTDTRSLGGVTRRVTINGLFEFHGNGQAGQAANTFNVFANGRVVAQVRANAVTSARSVRFVHRDQLGSPEVTTTESSGQVEVVERAKYEPFGERRYPWALAQPIKKAHGATSTLGFTGHEPDEDIGFVNMRGRLYDAAAGRFISPDPLAGGRAQRLNRYSYVLNSPASLIDPSGLGDCPSGEVACISTSGGDQYTGAGTSGLSPGSPVPTIEQIQNAFNGGGCQPGYCKKETKEESIGPPPTYEGVSDRPTMATGGGTPDLPAGMSLRDFAAYDRAWKAQGFALHEQTRWWNFEFNEMTFGEQLTLGLMRNTGGTKLGAAVTREDLETGVKLSTWERVKSFGGGLLDATVAATTVATPLAGGVRLTSGAARGTGAFLEGAAGGTGLGRVAGMSVRVSEKGLGIVERHLANFDAFAPNDAMVARLRGALNSGARISGADASFYFHEVSEATMMGRGLSYQAAHVGALGKYGVSPYSVYHPDVIVANPGWFNSNWFDFWGIK